MGPRAVLSLAIIAVILLRGDKTYLPRHSIDHI
jgi:hypothetical protein